jgi:D-serine deaminase-like pyridoxal phosphate-dependent protein
MSFSNLPTPSIILDWHKLVQNCGKMAKLATEHGVRLRPHLKTAKCIQVARLATEGHFGGLTVSTVAEARYFAESGFRDLTYAVGIAPGKIDDLHAIQNTFDAKIGLILDSSDAVIAVAERASAIGAKFSVFIEIDTGAGRGGVSPTDSSLLEIGEAIASRPHLRLAGVLTHAGHSYLARSPEEMRMIAADERLGAVLAANRLRSHGLQCEQVSIGSTPTVLHSDGFDGVTEIRPGVYTFFDIDQASLGVCQVSDIACTVLATVIGHNRPSGHILIDAGALALSKDLSPAKFRTDVQFGLISYADSSEPIPGLSLTSLHQEHGLISSSSGMPPYDRMPIGSRVRVFPNHVCLTVAPYEKYFVAKNNEMMATWDKARGW